MRLLTRSNFEISTQKRKAEVEVRESAAVSRPNRNCRSWAPNSDCLDSYREARTSICHNRRSRDGVSVVRVLGAGKEAATQSGLNFGLSRRRCAVHGFLFLRAS